MFGIDSGELLIIAIVALVVIGPKDLPRVMRAIGDFVGQARGMARHFRSGIDTMMRESELADMEKKWQADNDRIMRDHPPGLIDADPASKSVPGAGPGEAWPDPVAGQQAPLMLAKPPRLAKPRTDRPKPPPRNAAGGKAVAAAPKAPILAKAPRAKDEGA